MLYRLSLDPNHPRSHYFQIEGWMVSVYKFNPSELVIFAMIWHWCFSNNTLFISTDLGISRVTGVDQSKVKPILDRLCARNILYKKLICTNRGTLICGYVPNPDKFQGEEKTKWSGAIIRNILEREGILHDTSKQ